MIRLYLRNYKPLELAQLYNALHTARAELAEAGNPVKDLDDALVYISGYIDAKGDSGK